MDFELENEVPSSEALANGPTFEDLAIDDSLSDLERVTKYVCSNIALQRVIHVKMLQETARSVGFQTTCERLIPLLEPLVCDVEYVVRQHVAFQFPPLCRFLVDAGGDPGYSALLNKMIPLVTKLVSDDQHEVRSAASESLVDMAALVRAEDQGQHILTIVLPLAHDDDNEQFRIAAVSLYSGLAEHFGPELCQQFCVPELISLSEDPVFRVRKSTAQSFSNVCKTAGQELSRERLLPAFQRLATDDIWGVRKACAECLVSMSEALAPEARGPLLIPMFEAFVADSSRWVRMAAYQSLGPFMASLDTDQVSEELVEHFVSMATTAAAQLGGSGEVDIKFHCAFNFPAVVSILGASQWPTLSSTFETLYNDSFWKIRRSFAYSLHELARMLGQGITETQLATAFDSYLHDVQDVRLGAMLHFADFLEHVSPSFRESYLPVLTELDSFEQTTKWRFREVLSRQLAQLCRIFTPEATFSVVYPLVFKLVTDPVAIVRQESYHACPLLMSRLGGNPQWLTTVVEKFEGLATSAHYIDRQVYLKICGSFLVSEESTEKDQAEKTSTAAQHREMFATHLSSTFFKLAKDPVLNVCLVFAEIALPHRDFLRACDSCPEAIREQLAKDPAVSIEELATLLCEPIVKANGTENAAGSEEQAPTPPSEPDAGTAPPPAPTAEAALSESTEQLSLEEAPLATPDSNSTPTEAVDDAPDASSSTPDSDCASSKSSPPRPDAETPSDPPPGVAVDLAA